MLILLIYFHLLFLFAIKLFKYLNEGDNGLTGDIPPEIGNLTSLTFLDFGKICQLLMDWTIFNEKINSVQSFITLAFLKFPRW